MWDGLVGAIAVTLVDYIYIVLAILGIGKLLETSKFKKIFGIVSAIVLIIFGVMMIKEIMSTNTVTTIATHSTNLLASFTTVFLLAISSPLVIVFNTSLLTAKAIENNYNQKELTIFGLGVGLAPLIFISLSVLLFSLLKGTIPGVIIQVANLAVGCVLIWYGGIRLIKTLL